MNRIEFVEEVAKGGYDNDQIMEILKIIDNWEERLPVTEEDLLDASLQYLLIYMDIEKLGAFLSECDVLNRGYCISWPDAAQIAMRFIRGWA